MYSIPEKEFLDNRGLNPDGCARRDDLDNHSRVTFAFSMNCNGLSLNLNFVIPLLPILIVLAIPFC